MFVTYKDGDSISNVTIEAGSSVLIDGYELGDYGAISVTSTATEFTSTGNISLINNGTETVYMGTDASLTVANGYPIFPQAEAFFSGSIYLIAGSSGDIRYFKTN